MILIQFWLVTSRPVARSPVSGAPRPLGRACAWLTDSYGGQRDAPRRAVRARRRAGVGLFTFRTPARRRAAAGRASAASQPQRRVMAAGGRKREAGERVAARLRAPKVNICSHRPRQPLQKAGRWQNEQAAAGGSLVAELAEPPNVTAILVEVQELPSNGKRGRQRGGAALADERERRSVRSAVAQPRSQRATARRQQTHLDTSGEEQRDNHAR